MKHLVYCILRAVRARPGRLPSGVGGTTVTLVSADALAAAVSRVPDAALAANLARATTYASVIAALAAEHTVLPMRYGCVFTSRAQVHEFLRTRRTEFVALLNQLEGCVEMGIRALPAARERPAACPAPASFASYLAARRRLYARRAAARETDAALNTVLRRAFRRCSIRAVAAPAGTNAFTSMAFLIRRTHVAAFRRTFRRLQERYPYRLLLSGPWAPFNFVTGGGARGAG
jgi:hypothetical protein